MRKIWRCAAVLVAAAPLAGFSPVALYEDLFVYPEDELRALFREIVTGTGEACAAVTETAFLGADSAGSGFFVFACEGGERYILEIADDGTGRVVSCDLAPRHGLDCDRPPQKRPSP